MFNDIFRAHGLSVPGTEKCCY